MLRVVLPTILLLLISACQTTDLVSQDSDVVYKDTPTANSRMDIGLFQNGSTDHSMNAGQAQTEYAETHTIKSKKFVTWVWFGTLSNDRSYDTESRPDHFVRAFYTWPYLSKRNFEFGEITSDTHPLGQMQYGIGVDDKGVCMFFDVHFGSVYYSDSRFQNMIQGYRCVDSKNDVDMEAFVTAAKSVQVKP